MTAVDETRAVTRGTEPALDTPTAGDPRDAQPFSQRMRESTRTEHSSAETRGFITALMGGELTELDYWRMLGQYRPVYEALEEATLRALDDEKHAAMVAAFHDERLFRATAIRADFTARFGTEDPVIDGVSLTTALPGTARYAERIRQASVPALLAHHYLRYLGDLSGGQAIGALVARHYAVPREQLTMWDFSDIETPKRVKDAYRARLDDSIAPEVQDEYLAEVRHGYQLAGDLFAELDRR